MVEQALSPLLLLVFLFVFPCLSLCLCFSLFLCLSLFLCIFFLWCLASVSFSCLGLFWLSPLGLAWVFSLVFHVSSPLYVFFFSVLSKSPSRFCFLPLVRALLCLFIRRRELPLNQSCHEHDCGQRTWSRLGRLCCRFSSFPVESGWRRRTTVPQHGVVSAESDIFILTPAFSRNLTGGPQLKSLLILPLD